MFIVILIKTKSIIFYENKVVTIFKFISINYLHIYLSTIFICNILKCIFEHYILITNHVKAIETCFVIHF
jgi:hypothetical protein